MKVFSSIRSRLQTILFITVVPIFIIVLLIDIKERSKMEKMSKDDIQNLSLLAKKNIDNFLTVSRSLLIAISHLVTIAKENNNNNISLLFNDLIEHYPYYLNIGMADAKGDIVASAVSFTGTINASDLSWFKNALRTKDFSLGGYQIGRITGVPVMVMAMPYFDEDGNLNDVIFLSISLEYLEKITGDIELSEGYKSIITDNSNIVLSTYPYKKDRIGKKLPMDLSSIDSLEKTPHIYSIVTAGYKDNNIYIAIGIAKEKILNEINRDIKTHLLLFIGIILSSTICSWLFSKHFILLPLNKLTSGIKKIQDRDFNVKIDLKDSDEEFKTLGAGFEMMAESINKHITENLNADIKIRDNEARLKSILEAAPAVIIALTPKGDILEFNKEAEEVYKVKHGEVLGKNYYELFLSNKEKRIVIDIVQKVLVGEPVNRFENPVTTKTGEKLIFSWNFDRLTDAYGKVYGIIKAGIDITEIKEAEKTLKEAYDKVEMTVTERTKDLEKTQQALMGIVSDLNLKTAELEAANQKLKELDRLKSTFIASMSHELRTPLNSIIGFSSIILNEWVGNINQEQKDNIAIIIKAGKHLLSLINDIIDVSKIESGKVEPFIEEFDIYDLVNESVTYFEKEAYDKGIELRHETVHKIMHTDRRRLLQVIFNLLSNAIKATEKGSVSLAVVEKNDGCLELSVSDTGIGIMEEDFQKIFHSFSRIDEHRSKRLDGTGLGLYLSKKLLNEILKGDISFKSIYKKGSKFTIHIPISISFTDEKKKAKNLATDYTDVKVKATTLHGD